MYQNIAVERPQKNSMGYWTQGVVHLWDDEDGYIRRPLKDYKYAYKKDPNGQMARLI